MKDHIIESKVNKSANANSALIESAVEFVKEKMAGNDPSHDWYHVERVWRNAVHLAKEEEKRGQLVDMEVVELAALFHDIVDFSQSHMHTHTPPHSLTQSTIACS